MVRRTFALIPLEPRVLLSATHFAVIGDYGFTGPGEAGVAQLMKSWDPDLIVTVGDNNYYDGSGAKIDANVGQYFQEYIGNYQGVYGAGSPTNRFWPSLGNHDWNHLIGASAAGSTSAYEQYFTLPGNERYYDFTAGPVHFFALDADPSEPDGRSPTSVQGQWLQNALAGSTSQWNIVYFHHPPYNSGDEHGSTPQMQWPFKAWGADAVLAGHEHVYERIVDPTNGFPYFVNGIGGQERYDFNVPVAGSQVRFADEFGAMKVDADDQQMTFQFITSSGRVIDTYTLSADTAVPPVPTNVLATPVVSTQVNLTWSDTSTAESEFRIERSLDNVSYAQIGIVGPDVMSFQDRSVSPGAHFYYRVRAANSAGASAPSGSDDAITPADPISTLIPFGAVWKYLDNGSNQLDAWRATNFNDTSWSSGPAQLGYGDGDEATVIGFGPDPLNKYTTTYFRKAFTVADPAAVGSLLMRFLRDDGAAIYLNGVEVARSNIHEGVFSYSTPGARTVSESLESELHSVAIDPHLLLPGTNVIAVEIHQATKESSDLSFNLELVDRGVTGVAPMNALATPVGSSRIDLSWTDNFNVGTSYDIARSTDAVHFAPLASVSANQTTFSDNTVIAGTTYFYRVSLSAAGGGDSPPVTVSATAQRQGPTADVVDVAPDYRNSAVPSVSIVFSEPITGFDINDLKMTRDNGATNLLGAGQTLATSDGGKTWLLSGLSGITTANGRYALSLDSSAAGGIVSIASSTPMVGIPSDAWIMDTSPPAASSVPDLSFLSDAGASSTDNITRNTLLTFDGSAEPFTTVNLLVDGISVGSAAANDFGVWTLDVTLSAGTHQVTAIARDRALNSAPASAALQVKVDLAAPTADIVDITPDPRSTAVTSIAINFSEPVSGFDLSDLSLKLNGSPVSLSGMTLSSSDGGQSWTLADLTNRTGFTGTYVLTVTTGIIDIAGNALSAGASDTWEMTAGGVPAQVVRRSLFYNNSTFDGNNAAAGVADDLAIASDKTALITGKASFANYSSYSKGINGVMIDIAGLPKGSDPDAADFSFKVGNDFSDPANWLSGPTPTITVRRGEGAGGSDRITLIWKDPGSPNANLAADAVVGGWLRIAVLPTIKTGLAATDVFYFGNAVGEVGNATDPNFAITDARDYFAVRDHLRSYEAFPAPVTWAYDFNRDGLTDGADLLLVRAKTTTQANALKLITAPQSAPVVQPTATKSTVSKRSGRGRPWSIALIRGLS